MSNSDNSRGFSPRRRLRSRPLGHLIRMPTPEMVPRRQINNSDSEDSIPNQGFIKYEEAIFLSDWMIINKLNYIAIKNHYKFVWFDRRDISKINYLRNIDSEDDQNLVKMIENDINCIIGRLN